MAIKLAGKKPKQHKGEPERVDMNRLMKTPTRMSIDDIPLDNVQNQFFNLGNVYVGLVNPQKEGGAEIIVKLLQKLPKSQRDMVKNML